MEGGKHHHRDLSNGIMGTLDLSGMMTADVGMTYLTNRLTLEGSIRDTPLDHIYIRAGEQIHSKVNR